MAHQAQHFGYAPCFFYVGGAIGLVSAMNFFLLPETKARPAPATSSNRESSNSSQSIRSGGGGDSGGDSGGGGGGGGGGVDASLRARQAPVAAPAPRGAREVVLGTLVAWRRLATDPGLRPVLLAHLAYWMTLSGSQFTLLPLLASQQLGMSPAEIGSLFAMVSATQVS